MKVPGSTVDGVVVCGYIVGPEYSEKRFQKLLKMSDNAKQALWSYAPCLTDYLNGEDVDTREGI